MTSNNAQKITTLTRQLNTENAQYYEALVHSINVQSKLDTIKKEQLLLEILQEIVQLQNDGHDVETLFEGDPKVTSEYLLNEFSKRQQKQAAITRFLFLIFISFIQYGLFNALLEPVITISLFKTGIPIILLVLATFFLFKTFKTGLSFTASKSKQLLFPLLTIFCWLGFVLVPMIDMKLNGYNMNGLLSHQTFAIFLVIFSGICLMFQLKQKMSYTLIGVTIFFIVFDLFVLFGLIQPIYLLTTSKTTVSLILLLIISIGPFLEQKMRKEAGI